MSFPGLAHRMETIGAIGNVRFVNDSKATNIDAARQAMSSYPRFYWIAGGRPKSGGIEALADLFPAIARAYLVGEAEDEFAHTLEGRAPYARAGTLDAAVRAAFADARKEAGEAIVLFSPACASFDQYADFEERGEAFRAAVQAFGPTSPGPRRMTAEAHLSSHAFSRSDQTRFGLWWWTTDRILLGATVALILLGVLLQFGTSPAAAQRLGIAWPFHFAVRQCIFGAGGAAILIATSLLSPQGVRRVAFFIYLAAVAAMCALPILGHAAKGATRWVEIAGFTLQPSEFMKPALVVLMAWMFAEEPRRGARRPRRLHLAFCLYAIAVVRCSLAEPDIGQTVLITAAFGAAFWMAGVPMSWIMVMGSAAIVGLSSTYFLFQHVATRVDGFLGHDKTDTSQVHRAAEAIAAGKMFGRGPGEGIMKTHVPDMHTDFAYSAAAEEYGLWLSLLLDHSAVRDSCWSSAGSTRP